MSQQAEQLRESQVTLPEQFLVASREPTIAVMNCPNCDYSSTNKHYLRQHIDLVHTNERPFKCPFCDYAGKRSHSLKEHLIVHSDERPYKCTQCNAKFRKKGHLTNHYRMHSEAQSGVECSLCESEAFSCREELYIHLRGVHSDLRDIAVYYCNRCSYATTVKGNLHVHEMAHPDYRHVVLMKPKLPPKANIILKCSDCGFETNLRGRLEKHVLDMHMNDRGFPSTDMSLKHQQVRMSENFNTPKLEGNEGNVAAQNLAPKFKCTECGFITGDQDQLVRHAMEHRKTTQDMDITKSSATASATSNSEPAESTSRSTTQGVEYYTCSICGYICDTQRTLKAHMWKHSGHKNLEYPTFQNGPLSVYDNTPLAAKNFINNNVTSSISRQSSAESECLHRAILDKGKQKANNQIPHTVQSRFVEVANGRDGPSPKVIVQKLRPAEKLNFAVYDHKLSAVEHHLVPKERVVNASSSPPPNIDTPTSVCEKDIVNEQELPSRDPLKVMTAVCGAVERQTANTEDQPQVAVKAEGKPRINPDCYSATEKTAATLLSLLRQGPNINPACPPARYEYGVQEPQASRSSEEVKEGSDVDDVVVDDVACEEVVESEKAETMSSDSGQASDVQSIEKPKTGICSSLLAVIEQLRERQAEDTVHTSSKGRRKRKRTFTYDQKIYEVDVLPSDFTSASDIGVNLAAGDGAGLTAGDGMLYRCKLCHYRSSTHLMKQHMKMHKNKKPHECSLCDFVATGTSILQDHMIQHCKTRQFQCKQCSAVFNYKSQLRAHTRVHEDGQAFYCDHCEYVTSYIDSFQDHLNLHSEVITSFTCIACRDVFSDLRELQLHMKELCEEVKKLHKANPLLDSNASASQKSSDQSTRTLKCDQCEFIALSVRSLKSHLKRHVNDKRYIQQPLEQYKCNMCGYVCHHMPSLKSHMWRHANDTDFSYSFTNLLSDATTPVDKKGRPLITLRCCQCGFETLEKCELDKHMKTHWDIIRKTFVVENQNHEKCEQGAIP